MVEFFLHKVGEDARLYMPNENKKVTFRMICDGGIVVQG